MLRRPALELSGGLGLGSPPARRPTERPTDGSTYILGEAVAFNLLRQKVMPGLHVTELQKDYNCQTAKTKASLKLLLILMIEEPTNCLKRLHKCLYLVNCIAIKSVT